MFNTGQSDGSNKLGAKDRSFFYCFISLVAHHSINLHASAIAVGSFSSPVPQQLPHTVVKIEEENWELSTSSCKKETISFYISLLWPMNIIIINSSSYLFILGRL